ncbi:unnamed protein product [Peniophora sp. CBMAI 1063]|nr:unnamed protein product [Peniophora sp. CBMAI 1063]
MASSPHTSDLEVSLQSSGHCYVDMLPAELLTRVFKFVYWAYCAALVDRRHPYMLQELVVCKRWKAIIQGTPYFWQLIVPSPGNDRLRTQALEFSATQPLTFIASCNGAGLQDLTIMLRGMLEMDVLQRTRRIDVEHLLQGVELQVGDNLMPTVYPLIAQFLTGSEELEELQGLRIATSLDFKNVAGRQMRNLHSLHLEAVRRPPDVGRWARSLRTLIFVNIRDIDSSSFMRALERMDTLEELEITMTSLHLSRDRIRQPGSLLLPKLERLTLYTELIDMDTLLVVFTLPKLSLLALHAYATRAEPLPDLQGIYGAITAVIEDHPCDEVDLAYTAEFKRSVPLSNSSRSQSVPVIRFAVGAGLTYQVVRDMTLSVMARPGLMRSIRSITLNIPQGYRTSEDSWREALRGLEFVQCVELGASARDACCIFNVLRAVQPDTVVLPFLKRVIYRPFTFDKSAANAIVSLLKRRSVQSDRVQCVLNPFIFMRDVFYMLTTQPEVYGILSDDTLLFPVRYCSMDKDPSLQESLV